jgi:hypothetical protein
LHITRTDWELIEPLLEAQKIVIDMTFDAGGDFSSFNPVSTPPDVDLWEAIDQALYEQGLVERIYGPWKFTVEVDPSSR